MGTLLEHRGHRGGVPKPAGPPHPLGGRRDVLHGPDTDERCHAVACVKALPRLRRGSRPSNNTTILIVAFSPSTGNV